MSRSDGEFLGSRELTPEQARAAAKEVLAKVAPTGKDPAALLQREREMSTFREFAHRYLRERWAQKTSMQGGKL